MLTLKTKFEHHLIMLAIEKKTKGYEGKWTPNVLPCRINHNGTVDASKRYWNPTQTPGKQTNSIQLTFTDLSLADGKISAYFRGRKLYGKKVNVPEGYKGVVLSSTDRILPKSAPEPTEDEDDVEEEPEVKVMEEQSDFDHIMVWGHESVPEDAADPYVKGMDEWIAFSEQVCSLYSKRSMAGADGHRFIRINLPNPVPRV